MLMDNSDEKYHLTVVVIAEWFASFSFVLLGDGAEGYRFESQSGLLKIYILIGN